MSEFFPRTTDLPNQSPLFWVQNKDRYLRQLMIRDIQSVTNRKLIVYFADTERVPALILPGDDVYLRELLLPCFGAPVDLLLETNGGVTDATEKICSILRQMCPDFRVVVPRRAKSNGTVIALAGSSIVMTELSELGPIDPSLGGVPTEFLVQLPDQGNLQLAIEKQIAHTARLQTRKLAGEMLRTGMMKGRPDQEVDDLVEKIATRTKYHSHGSVIDAVEAESLGLAVTHLKSTDDLAQRFWLLRSMLSYDCGARNYAKIFESEQVSSAVLPPPSEQQR